MQLNELGKFYNTADTTEYMEATRGNCVHARLKVHLNCQTMSFKNSLLRPLVKYNSLCKMKT